MESIFTISGTVKQIKALELRIGPLIKYYATFSSYMVHTVAGHLRFPIQYPPPLIDYSLNHSNLA